MTKPRGYILIVTGVLMSILLLYSISLVNVAVYARNAEKKEDLKVITNSIAEAGIQKAIWCLNQTSGTNCGGSFGGGYNGESDEVFGGGVFDTVVTNIGGDIKQIEATAYYPNKTKAMSKSVIRTKASVNTDISSFVYGMQVGQGGLEMGTGARINGSVYSHGDVSGWSDSEITGDLYVAGGTALDADQSWTVKNGDFIFAKTNPQIDIAQSFTPSITNVLNKISIYIKRSNWPGDISVKIVNDNNNLPGTTIIASSNIDASDVSTSYGWINAAFSNPPPVYAGTKYWLVLDASQSSTKYWTMGIDAFDDYGGGTMLYSQNWSGGSWVTSGKDANFKIWLGGITTGIDNMRVDGNAYAHTIDDSDIHGNASTSHLYDSSVTGNVLANEISGSSISGNATTTDISFSTVGKNLWCQNYFWTAVGWARHCPTSVTGPTDPGPTNMPISDALIDEWKNDAAEGGTTEGNVNVSGTTSLGPKKINGNLTVASGATLNITGTIYVTGNITVGNSYATIRLDSSYGATSGILIADGIITLGNDAILAGAEDGSYLAVVSTLNSSTQNAIDVGNRANGAIFYAPYGIIDLGNNATFKEICAYRLNIGNNLILDYERGIENVSFSSGPSGGWSELKGSWTSVE